MGGNQLYPERMGTASAKRCFFRKEETVECISEKEDYPKG